MTTTAVNLTPRPTMSNLTDIEVGSHPIRVGDRDTDMRKLRLPQFGDLVGYIFPTEGGDALDFWMAREGSASDTKKMAEYLSNPTRSCFDQIVMDSDVLIRVDIVDTLPVRGEHDIVTRRLHSSNYDDRFNHILNRILDHVLRRDLGTRNWIRNTISKGTETP